MISSVVYLYPLDSVSVSVAGQFESGQPINLIPDTGIYGTTDLNGDGASFTDAYLGNSDRAPGVSRNADRLPWSATIDLGLRYEPRIGDGRLQIVGRRVQPVQSRKPVRLRQFGNAVEPDPGVRPAIHATQRRRTATVPVRPALPVLMPSRRRAAEVVVVLLAAIAFASSANAQTEDWDAVVAQADGQTVYFNAWGGDLAINRYLEWAAARVREEYGVELRHVRVTDIAESVTRIIAERTAGRDSGGSVDLLWINGENFAALKRAGLLYGPWAMDLPNAARINWQNNPDHNDRRFAANRRL